MAHLTADIGTGATITFNGSWAQEIRSISWGGVTRPSLDTTHLGSTLPTANTNFGGRTFIPGDMADPGEITVEFNFQPSPKATTTPPITDAAGSIAVTWLDSAGASGGDWTCTGFCTAYSVDTPLEDVMTGSATFKLSGLAVITDDTP